MRAAVVFAIFRSCVESSWQLCCARWRAPEKSACLPPEKNGAPGEIELVVVPALPENLHGAPCRKTHGGGPCASRNQIEKKQSALVP